MVAVNIYFPALLLLLSLNSATTTTPMAKPGRLAIKLIYRDSILYNPTDTLEERAQRAIDHTIARAAYIQERIIRTTQLAIDDYRAPLIGDGLVGLFLANISIGRPPVPQLLILDTASSLLWVQCQPCTACFPQSVPIYDPSKSSTYKSLACSSYECEVSRNTKCNANLCEYTQQYADGSKSVGNLASEELVFTTSDDGIVTVPISVFGCGHENSGDFGKQNQQSGIFGIDSYSTFINDNGAQFSYCLGDITDPLYMYNQFIIGNKANLDGHATPIDSYKSFYYLTLEGISVGDKKLDIDPKVFQRKLSGEGGVIIDSGTNYLVLQTEGFNPLLDEIRRVIGGRLREITNPGDPAIICYRGDLHRDLNWFPLVTFHFADGADLVLESKSMFYSAAREDFCLAAYGTDQFGFSIIGVLAQQFYNFGYDVIGHKLYIQKIDCALLDE